MQVIIKYEFDDVVENAYKQINSGFSKNTTPFIDYAWTKSMQEHIDDKRKVFFVFKERSTVIAVCGLKIVDLTVFGLKVKLLKFINNNISDYNGICFLNNQKASQIAKYFYKSLEMIALKYDAVDFDNIKSNCFLSNELVSQSKCNFITSSVIQRSECPLLFLDRENIDILKKARKDTERCLKRLREEYDVEIKVGKKIKKKEFINILKLKEATYGIHDLSNSHNQKIILNAISHGLQYDYSYIKCNGEIVAAHFGFIDNDTFYYYIPTFDRVFSKFSIGNILLLSLIVFYKDKGLHKFDFLRGGEVYKKNWTSSTFWNYEIIGSITKKGKLTVKYLEARRYLSRLKKRV